MYLEGLKDYSEQEIEEFAAPLLEELDLDFEHIFADYHFVCLVGKNLKTVTEPDLGHTRNQLKGEI